MHSQRIEQIKVEAVEWLVMLKDPDVDPDSPFPTHKALWIAFTEWYTQSPEHLAAFIEAAEIDDVVRRIDSERVIDLEELRRQPPDNVVPLPPREETELRPSSLSQQGVWRTVQRRKRVIWAACVLALSLVAVPLVVSSMHAAPIIYSTTLGERLFVPLGDGSTAELNTNSRIDVEWNSKLRQVTLLAGEVIFDVRHDAARPLRVASGGAVIRDLGTRFAVRQENGATTVSVIEGSVEISTNQSRPAVVEAHQEATVSGADGHADLKIRAVTGLELRSQLAWQEGRLEFTGQTLAEAVAKLNRYNRRQVRIPDSSVARLAVGGSFFTTDCDAFLATVEQVYGLRATPSPANPNVIEISRAEPSH